MLKSNPEPVTAKLRDKLKDEARMSLKPFAASRAPAPLTYDGANFSRCELLLPSDQLGVRTDEVAFKAKSRNCVAKISANSVRPNG